jgi:hypothetical protein
VKCICIFLLKMPVRSRAGLCKLGEDISEMLEYIPSSSKVIRHG